MTKELIERSRRRHTFAEPAMLAIAGALALSLAIAAVIVTIGIFRAGAFGHGGLTMTAAAPAAVSTVRN